MMAAKDNRIYVPYDEARPYMLDSDVLLYRKKALISRLISIYGRTHYSHAAMAGWVNGQTKHEPYARLFAYEMRYNGGAGTRLSAHAENWSGLVDVYRVSDTHTVFSWDPTAEQQKGRPRVLDRREAVMHMKDFCNPGTYGYWHLFKTALTHLPILRFFFKPPTDDKMHDGTNMPYCSEAISYALRKAFTDVVKNTPDQYTEPGDLAKSPLLHYMFTLVASTPEDVT
jgi:hypothetical protein